jgi:hypothetical protein
MSSDTPWWFPGNITFWDIMATPEAIKDCRLPPTLVQKILHTQAYNYFATRPYNANKKWVEPVNHEGTTYLLSCEISQILKKLVVTHIRAPKKIRKNKRHK